MLFAAAGAAGVGAHMMHHTPIPERLRIVAFQQHRVRAALERPTDRTCKPVRWEPVPV